MAFRNAAQGRGKNAKLKKMKDDFQDFKEQILAYERQSVTKIREHIPYVSLRDTVTTSKHTQQHTRK